MTAAQTIRDAIANVTALRVECQNSRELQLAMCAIKEFQAWRFAHTYDDLIKSAQYGTAAKFFLEELYGNKDYSDRDSQFARIAGGLQRLFPEQVIGTAIALARLHRLTEELDHAMAVALLQMPTHSEICTVSRYVSIWKIVGRFEDRYAQLNLVLQIGNDMVRLTRTPGLRMMLRMMRRPAKTMGMSSLQHFLETGFDTFASLSTKEQLSAKFLATIAQRETTLMNILCSDQSVEMGSQAFNNTLN
jgi:hypothetical protein